MELEKVFKSTVIKMVKDHLGFFWFKAKDVAIVLEYKDPVSAVKTHVDDEDKKTLDQLVELSDYMSGNECKTIYINETGIYSLIFKSKMEEAKKFRKWIFEDILPSIRKEGEYKLKKQIEQITEGFQKLQHYSMEQIEKFKKEKEDFEKYTEELGNFMGGIKPLIQDEIIYVLTSDRLLKENIFKVGKTTVRNFKSRLSTYQTGSDEERYYIYAKCVFFAGIIEDQVKSLLDKFKLTRTFNNKEKTIHEMYKIYFDDLKALLDSLIEPQTNIGNYINSNYKNIFKNSRQMESVASPISVLQVVSPAKTVSSVYSNNNGKKSMEDWISKTVVKGSFQTDFVGLPYLVDKYKEYFNHEINTKREEVEQVIISAFNKQGAYIKKIHYYRSNNKNLCRRSVFVGYRQID